MRITKALLTLVLVFLLAACSQTGNSTLPGASITSITPTSITPGVEIVITGRGFYQHADGQGTTVEVCGITVAGSLVGAATQTVVLPPAGRIKVETGNRITVTLPEDGFEAGDGQLRVIRPDGSSSVFGAGVTCQPQPEPEPELPEPEPEQPEPELPEPELPGPEHPEPEQPEPELPGPELPEPELPGPELPDPGVPENKPPTAVFTVSFLPDDPLTVALDAGGSEDPDGSITGYTWDLGDGNTASGITTTHTYSSHGTYTITLTTTDNHNATAQTSQETRTYQGALIRIRTTPEELNPLITITDPNNFSRPIPPQGTIVVSDLTTYYHLTASTKLLDLGSYTESWHANPPTQTVHLQEGEEHSVHFHYTVQTGALELTTDGLPELVLPDYTIERLHSGGTWVPLCSPTAGYCFPDLGGLTPGDYRLVINPARVQKGTVARGDRLVEEYVPTDNPIPFSISSNVTSSVTINYQLQPGSISIGTITGLPAGIPADYALRAGGTTDIPEPWDNLPPGRYYLHFYDVDYENTDGLELRDGTRTDAFERYEPQSTLKTIYLSSNEHVIENTDYAVGPALLHIRIASVTGEPIAGNLITITDSEGTIHRYTQQTHDNDYEQLYLPLGEYHLEINTPPGYSFKSHPTNNYHLLDMSYYYGNVAAQHSIEVTYVRIPTPVVANFTFSPPDPVVGQEVVFDASSSTGEGQLTYSWSFFGTQGSGVTPSHAFSYSGVWPVTLTVTSENGQKNMQEQIIWVHPTNLPD